MRALQVAVLVVTVMVAAGCEPRLSSERATSDYRACLDRHGVVAEDVQVTIRADGSIESIDARILSEGEVAYEPAIRLACTEEIEGP